MKAIIIFTVLCGMAMANACLKGCYTTICVDPNTANAASKKVCDNSLKALTACGEKNCKSDKNPFQCVESKCLADANAKNFWTCAVSKCKKSSKMRTVRSVMSISDVMESYELEHENDEEQEVEEEDIEEEFYNRNEDAKKQCRVGCVSKQCHGERSCINGLKSFVDCVRVKCQVDHYSDECVESKCKPTAQHHNFVNCLHGCSSISSIDVKNALASIREARVIDLTKTTSSFENDFEDYPSYATTTPPVRKSANVLSFTVAIIALIVASL